MKKLLIAALAVAGLSTAALNACRSCKSSCEEAPQCVKMVEKRCPAKKVCTQQCHYECPEGTRMAKEAQPRTKQAAKTQQKRSAEY